VAPGAPFHSSASRALDAASLHYRRPLVAFKVPDQISLRRAKKVSYVSCGTHPAFGQNENPARVQATNWMRTIAEQNLNQSKAALEGLLTFTRNALRSVDQQSSAVCDHSIAVAEQTLSNSFDFAHKVIRVKEP